MKTYKQFLLRIDDCQLSLKKKHDLRTYHQELKIMADEYAIPKRAFQVMINATMTKKK